MEAAVTCNICKTNFSSVSDLVLHFERGHIDQDVIIKDRSLANTHSCACGRTFNSKSSLLRHYRNDCPSRKFNCGKCSRAFKSQKNFKKHCRSHGFNEFMCEKCGRGYHSSTMLNHHLNKCVYKPKTKNITNPKSPKKSINTHLDFELPKTKRTKKCQYCKQEFNRTFNIRRHMTSCSKKSLSLDLSVVNNSTSDTNNNACQYCSKRLSCKKNILRHKRICKHKPSEPTSTQTHSQTRTPHTETSDTLLPAKAGVGGGESVFTNSMKPQMSKLHIQDTSGGNEYGIQTKPKRLNLDSAAPIIPEYLFDSQSEDAVRDISRIYREKWRNIMTFILVNQKVQDLYNLRFPNYNDGLGAIPQFLTTRLLPHQTRAFKINFSPSFILRHIETGELRYYYGSSFNNRILESPKLITSGYDFQCFINELESLDLLNFCKDSRPDTKWVILTITNVTFFVDKINTSTYLGKVGATVVLPEYIKRMKSLISLTNHPKTGIAYTDNLCLFRCLAMFFGGDCRKLERPTARYFKEIVGESVSPQNFGGVSLLDLYKIEDRLNININVFSISPKLNNLSRPEDLVVEWVHRSREIYKRTMNLNLYKEHFSYILNLQSYAKSFVCDVCQQILPLLSKLKQHKKTCENAVKYRYGSGVYKPNLSIFEKLEQEGLDITEIPRFFEYRATFDLESFFNKNNLPPCSEFTEWTAQHIPMSVGVCSNVPGYQDGRCIISTGNSKQMVSEMLTYLNDISNEVYR